MTDDELLPEKPYYGEFSDSHVKVMREDPRIDIHDTKSGEFGLDQGTIHVTFEVATEPASISDEPDFESLRLLFGSAFAVSEATAGYMAWSALNEYEDRRVDDAE